MLTKLTWSMWFSAYFHRSVNIVSSVVKYGAIPAKTSVCTVKQVWFYYYQCYILSPSTSSLLSPSLSSLQPPLSYYHHYITITITLLSLLHYYHHYITVHYMLSPIHYYHNYITITNIIPIIIIITINITITISITLPTLLLSPHQHYYHRQY